MARLIFRIMLALWLLMTVVLIDAYTGTLISFLTTIKHEPIPNTLEEVVNSNYNKECLLTMQKGHTLMQKFHVISLCDVNGSNNNHFFIQYTQNSNYKPYKKVDDWFAQHENYFTNKYEKITSNIVDRKCTHIGVNNFP